MLKVIIIETGDCEYKINPEWDVKYVTQRMESYDYDGSAANTWLNNMDADTFIFVGDCRKESNN
jgi:hypothetical protein